MTGQKKPWRRVGKLEARIKHLEDVVERQYKHYCMDHEEINKKFSDEIKQIIHEIDIIHKSRNIVLQNIRKTIDNLIDPEK